jgi:hypothetical protein
MPRVEAATYDGQTLVSLLDQYPTTLNNSTNAGLGNVTFAAQWSISLPANTGSKTFSIIMNVIPEPSSFALISSGILTLSLLRRRRRTR